MSALTISVEDEKRVKAMGFLSNKGTDLFSGRIITVNGKVTAAQQRCILEAAEKFGNGTITFTTRLTIEVPGIPYDKIEEFQKYIAKGNHSIRLVMTNTRINCTLAFPFDICYTYLI